MGNRLHVSLVDDEGSFTTIASVGLGEEYRIDVTVAESGMKAVELMKASKIGFDVIVLDYRMPGMTGLHVLRWMSENGIQAPSFMLTGAGSE